MLKNDFHVCIDLIYFFGIRLSHFKFIHIKSSILILQQGGEI